MPPEPKKPIEQMLEALAKARRVQFGNDPKMPNPMRARLHEEVARGGTAEDEDGASRPSWTTMFWPRVTVAAALATLIVLVPAIWWNQSHPVSGVANVAVRDRGAGAVNQLTAAKSAEDTLANAQAVSASGTRVNLADNKQVKIEPAATPSSEAETLTPSTRLAEGRPATESQTQTMGGFDKEIASAKVQAAPAAAPIAGEESKAKSDRMSAAAPPIAQPSSAGNLAMSQQSAVQSFRNTAQVNRAANVLNTFQIQQQGNEIRVLDGDGSTYAGKIEQLAKSTAPDAGTAARRAAAKQTRAYTAKAVRKNESAAPQSSFRATGYNVSLKKTIVFEGNYVAPPAQQAATAPNDKDRGEQSRDQARIVGTVRVNGEPPVEVDAIAETPTPTKKSEK